MVLDSPLLRDEEVKTIADKHNVSAATVLISYQVNRGCIVLPKSVTPARIEQNLKVIALPQEDMEILDDMAAKGKQQRVNTPLFGHDLVNNFYLRASWLWANMLFRALMIGTDREIRMLPNRHFDGNMKRRYFRLYS